MVRGVAGLNLSGPLQRHNCVIGSVQLHGNQAEQEVGLFVLQLLAEYNLADLGRFEQAARAVVIDGILEAGGLHRSRGRLAQLGSGPRELRVTTHRSEQARSNPRCLGGPGSRSKEIGRLIPKRPGGRSIL